MRVLTTFMTLIVSLALPLLYSCDKEGEKEPTPPAKMEVTYISMDGAWQLTEWNDEPLADGLYCYVQLDGTKQRFEMHDNLGSMYDNVTTGTFSIEQNDKREYLLRGTYDYGVGDWNDEYVVSMYKPGNSMSWLSSSGDDMCIYTRIDSIPEL